MPSVVPYRLGAAMRSLAASVMSLGVAAPLLAQGLPPLAPINPVATSRSGVYFQPYRDPVPGVWSVALELDYGSAIEYNELEAAEYILDSELLRLNVAARRDIGRRHFVLVDVGVRGAYDGFMDGFLDWYHARLGIRIRERERRPQNEFLYRVAPDNAPAWEQGPGALFLGDARVGVGRRYSPAVQGVLSITLPTATGPSGYGRGVVSANVLHTARAPLSRRWIYEGSVGLGYTPRHGRLAGFEREVFGAVSSGLRARTWGRQALYANLMYQSPYYRQTGLPALDRYELAFDFGWLLATCTGTEWRLGLTEDLKPSGPGIDFVIRLGVALRTETAPCAGARTPSPPARED
jgi:hypothetical protein